MLTNILTELGESLGIADKSFFGLLVHALNILLIILLARIVVVLSRHVLRRLKNSKSKLSGVAVSDANKTVLTLLQSVIKYVVYFLAAAGILSELGLGVTAGSILATAGIGGLAIGFGAQDLIKDVVAGFFMLFENQFTVGDYIQTGTIEGTVEALTLRTTIIRGARGEKHIVPNGTITMLTNYSKGNYTALVEVGIARDQNLDKALMLMQQAADEALKDHPNVVDAPQVVGITALTPTEATLRVTCAVKPLAQWEIERMLRKGIMTSFSVNGIHTPYQKTVWVQPDGESS